MKGLLIAKENDKYGYVKGQDGKAYLADVDTIEMKIFLNDGVDVIFDPKETKKGLRAENIVPKSAEGKE